MVKSYVLWVRRFLSFHSLRHPREMGSAGVNVSGEVVSAAWEQLDGTPSLVVGLLYVSGLWLMEALRLRVKDLEFQLLGHGDVSTTLIYTHVLNSGPLGVHSTADFV